MPKGIGSIKTVALNYYIGANLIAFVPSLIIGVMVDKIARAPWQYILYEVLLFVSMVYFAFKLSARNINKGFVVTNQRSIANWSIGYVIFFNGMVILLSFVRFGYISVSPIASLLSTIGEGIIIYKFTPKFLLQTPIEEINQIKTEASVNPKKVISIGKRILKTAGITLLIGVTIIAIFIIFILYSEH